MCASGEGLVMKKNIIAACMAMTLATPTASVHASEVSNSEVQTQQLYYKPGKHDQAYWGVVVNCRD